MLDKKLLTENIIKGIQNGYRQNLLLLSSYDYFVDDVREYLLTVNVAQQLLEWNSSHNYEIRIEYPVAYFYDNAFIKNDLKGSDIFNLNLISRRSDHSPTNKLCQKLDIAITQEEFTGVLSFAQTKSKCGIELKGINTWEHDIVEDAGRMSRAMLKVDEISENSIEYCFCAFLRRLDGVSEIVTEESIRNKKDFIRSHWSAICKQLDSDFPGLKFTCNIFTVESTSYESIAMKHMAMQSDYSEVAKDTGLICGIIIAIERLSNIVDTN